MFIATRPRNIFELVASIGRVDNAFFMSFYFILPAIALWVRVSRRKERECYLHQMGPSARGIKCRSRSCRECKPLCAK